MHILLTRIYRISDKSIVSPICEIHRNLHRFTNQYKIQAEMLFEKISLEQRKRCSISVNFFYFHYIIKPNHIF